MSRCVRLVIRHVVDRMQRCKLHRVTMCMFQTRHADGVPHHHDDHGDRDVLEQCSSHPRMGTPVRNQQDTQLAAIEGHSWQQISCSLPATGAMMCVYVMI
jgi:hypothetical protein